MSSETSRRPRVLVADDDSGFRYAIKLIIEQLCDVIGEAKDGVAAVELAAVLRPDLVLLDISMPLMTGLEAARAILERRPGTLIIIVSSHADAVDVREAYAVGAARYVVKDEMMITQLPQAIRDAIDGIVFQIA